MFTSLRNECRYCPQVYFQLRRTIDPSRVYFFDETHFNFETDERDYGRTDSGLTCPSFREKGRARAGKYSTLAVCGFTEGVIQAIPVTGTLTAELVTEIIENQVLPLLPVLAFWLQIMQAYTMKLPCAAY